MSPWTQRSAHTRSTGIGDGATLRKSETAAIPRADPETVATFLPEPLRSLALEDRLYGSEVNAEQVSTAGEKE